MRYLKYLALLVAVALPSISSHAQVAVGVQIGPDYGFYNPPPVCTYGYYPYYPFACVPYGYYGPEWFVEGVFIGAGPWDHFYFRHPEFYRHGYWVGPAYRYRGGFEHFRDVHHDFRGEDRWDRGDRGFHGEHGFRDGDRGFRGDRDGFHGESNFHERRDGGHGWRGEGHGDHGWRGEGHGDGGRGWRGEGHGDGGHGHGHEGRG